MNKKKEQKTGQTQWSNAYNAKAYDRVALLVKKGDRERIKTHAAQRGLSINAYINGLIAADMHGAADSDG